MSSFLGLAETIAAKGLFISFYTDRGSHYFFTPEAGGKVSKDTVTQVGRALAQLGIKLFHRKTPPHPYEYVIWIGGLLLTVAVTAGIGRIALRMLAEAGAVAPEDEEEKPQAAPVTPAPHAPPETEPAMPAAAARSREPASG